MSTERRNIALELLEHGIPEYVASTSYEEIHLASLTMVMEGKCPTCRRSLGLVGWCPTCKHYWSATRIDQHSEIRLETRTSILRWTLEPVPLEPMPPMPRMPDPPEWDAGPSPLPTLEG